MVYIHTCPGVPLILQRLHSTQVWNKFNFKFIINFSSSCRGRYPTLVSKMAPVMFPGKVTPVGAPATGSISLLPPSHPASAVCFCHSLRIIVSKLISADTEYFYYDLRSSQVHTHYHPFYLYQLQAMKSKFLKEKICFMLSENASMTLAASIMFFLGTDRTAGIRVPK